MFLQKAVLRAKTTTTKSDENMDAKKYDSCNKRDTMTGKQTYSLASSSPRPSSCFLEADEESDGT